MKKTAILLLLSAVLSLPAAAEPLHYQILRFSETVSRDVPNDWMTLRLRVQTRHADAAQAAAGTTRKLNILQSRLRTLSGIESQLQYRSAYPGSESGQNGRNQRIWQDEAVLSVSGADFQALGKLLAQSSGEAVVDNVSFSLKPATRQRIVETLSTEALRRFQERAQALSQTMGGSGYKVVEVDLVQTMQAGSRAYRAQDMAYAAATPPAPEQAFDTPGLTTVSQTASGRVQYQ
ncbi:SIMPL domain-containing protein [Neisseria shayeganii]|uniref:Periplasmic/secreted protein n=1 Tax=Neisseria shayeganii 871 TaxID=1032488 RepID=G4CFT9_9NEIS|nr:SIMPL domain-containing protein [Neisseria shayeganii]EGY53293.1 hypothetical protein HMPREF9371_0478 [Neisseria shayeganii 871]